MKELMKKILTDKRARSISVFSVFLLSAMTTMAPWET